MSDTDLRDLKRVEVLLGPTHSRLWIFAIEGKLSAEKGQEFRSIILPFIETWKAHKIPVQGRIFLFEGKFLLVSADEGVTKVSGCSTDSLFRAVIGAADSLGIKLSDPASVHYRSSGANSEIITLSRAAFKELAKSGEIHLETPVFDPTLGLVDEVLQGKFERPVKDSWHARLIS